MKKILFITLTLLSRNSFSQNAVRMSNIGLGNQFVQQSQNIQVLASNLVNNNTANKPLRTNIRANANPQVIIQRTSNANSNQRRQVRRRVTNPANTNVSNPVQTNNLNVIVNAINNDIQPLISFSQQADNNLVNMIENENIIEQIASANIPAIQVGTGAMDLNLDINMPKIKLPSMKLSSRKSVSSSKHKTFRFKNKLAKMNRKMTGKLSFGKKLKIKVDNCFKW